MGGSEHASRFAVDIVSAGVVLATLASWLPPMAALMTVVWTAIRIWETKTVQSLVARWRDRR